MQQIYKRTHMPKCDFNKVVLLQICCIFSAQLLLRSPLASCFWLLIDNRKIINKVKRNRGSFRVNVKDAGMLPYHFIAFTEGSPHIINICKPLPQNCRSTKTLQSSMKLNLSWWSRRNHLYRSWKVIFRMKYIMALLLMLSKMIRTQIYLYAQKMS